MVGPNKIALLLVLSLYAATNPSLSKASDSDADIEIGGLLIDEAITRGGHDFFDQFSVKWQHVFGEAPYNIRISERAGTGRGTFVMIHIEHNMVFQSRLDPLPDAIEQLANLAVGRVLRLVTQRKSELQELDYY